MKGKQVGVWQNKGYCAKTQQQICKNNHNGNKPEIAQKQKVLQQSADLLFLCFRFSIWWGLDMDRRRKRASKASSSSYVDLDLLQEINLKEPRLQTVTRGGEGRWGGKRM